jgi:hypothetical protein
VSATRDQETSRRVGAARPSAAPARPSAPTTPGEISQEAPLAGEEIHLPGPSILPFVTAIAITLMVIGTTINWLFSIIGLVIFVVVVLLWVRDTRRDIASLPEEHH